MKAETPKKLAAKRAARKLDNPEQFERFVETARKLGVDESGEKFDRAFEKIAKPRKIKGN
jgi:hypothetical protein